MKNTAYAFAIMAIVLASSFNQDKIDTPEQKQFELKVDVNNIETKAMEKGLELASGSELGIILCENGKTNTAALQATTGICGYGYYAKMGTFAQKFNETPENNQGYSDWYIPACGQMALICTNITEINAAITAIGGEKIENYMNMYYWTSTEHSDNQAYSINVSTNEIKCKPKSNGNQVRLVRDF